MSLRQQLVELEANIKSALKSKTARLKRTQMDTRGEPMMNVQSHSIFMTGSTLTISHINHNVVMAEDREYALSTISMDDLCQLAEHAQHDKAAEKHYQQYR